MWEIKALKKIEKGSFQRTPTKDRNDNQSTWAGKAIKLLTTIQYAACLFYSLRNTLTPLASRL